MSDTCGGWIYSMASGGTRPYTFDPEYYAPTTADTGGDQGLVYQSGFAGWDWVTVPHPFVSGACGPTGPSELDNLPALPKGSDEISF